MTDKERLLKYTIIKNTMFQSISVTKMRNILAWNYFITFLVTAKCMWFEMANRRITLSALDGPNIYMHHSFVCYSSARVKTDI